MRESNDMDEKTPPQNFRREVSSDAHVRSVGVSRRSLKAQSGSRPTGKCASGPTESSDERWEGQRSEIFSKYWTTVKEHISFN